MKRTPLYDTHSQMGGKLIDFGGWALPVQYAGILEEHEKVRTSAGLFDVSHMGEITVKGKDAERFIQKLVTNDISHAEDFQIVYSPMCYPNGGVVDDLLVYRINTEDYLLVVNASNTDKDFDWIQSNLEGEVEVENVSQDYAQLALQGPKAQAILQKLTGEPLDDILFYHFRTGVDIKGVKTLVSRTGYTGEDGFELYFSWEEAEYLWKILLDTGKEDGLVPAGLGARDTLRFEAGLPLYGQEIAEDITPLEAGLEKFVKLGKEDFIGKQALEAQQEKGIQRRLVGFEMIDRGIPRSHYEIESAGENIGFVTTGSFSPSLKKNLGMSIIGIGYAQLGTEFDVVIRGKLLKAKVISLPFYKKRYKR